MKINLEYIQKKLIQGRTIEEIVASFDWKEFESLVNEIFVANGYFVKKNFRFKTTRRYEIDLLAVHGEIVFAVDCKEWSKGRYKASGLRTASEKQEQRVRSLKKFLKNNIIAQKRLKINKQEILPIIVTWLQEDLQKYNNSIIIPVWKLNNFLLHAENFISTQ